MKFVAGTSDEVVFFFRVMAALAELNLLQLEYVNSLAPAEYNVLHPLQFRTT